MYEFVDRPVTSLRRGGELVVWAMRHWVRAASTGRCPCGDVAPAFHKRDLMPAFPHFHMMMAVLNREAILQLRFGSVDCERVSEHEALLLSLLRAMHLTPGGQARATAALIVAPDSVTTLTIAMTALAQGLADANLLPRVPLYFGQHASSDDE